MRAKRVLIFGLVLTATGCVRRSMSIQTDPPGALVYLNGEEAGRTPLQRDFLWYGTYDVVIRKEGAETLRTRQRVIAPWWQWPPFDLFAELFPLDDKRSYQYTLTPAADSAVDLDAILQHSGDMQAKLQSSQAPATQPAR